MAVISNNYPYGFVQEFSELIKPWGYYSRYEDLRNILATIVSEASLGSPKEKNSKEFRSAR